MPRSKTAASTSLSVPDSTSGQASLVAAARRLTGKPDVGKISRTGRGWQEKSWEFFDTVGEFRYGADWVGNMLSKATLYPAYDGKALAVEEDHGEVATYVSSLFGGTESQGELLRQCGVHLTVAGELFVVGWTEDGVDQWQVVAATELSARAGRWYASGTQIGKGSEPFILRLWRPHPRKGNIANAPARAVLAILSEIDSLTKHVFAQIDSRLAGAGILMLPSELTMATSAQNAAGEQQNEGTAADRFQSQLQEAMVTAIGDREDASAMVPIVILAPGEQIGNAKHLTFWSELDKQAIELRNEAIRRLALGLDLPPEIITGTADLNHWSSWGVSEEAIKAHAEPLLNMVTESLTTGYLRPLLIDDGMDPAEAERYSIEADTSLMRVRPNRSQEAFELYDRGQLSSKALLREVGFDATDAPDADETKMWFLRKVASGSTTPELVAAALQTLGILGPASAGAAPPAEARPTPSLEDHPVTGPPEQPATVSPSSGDDGLFGAAEVIVYRALERAGNRLKNRVGTQRLANIPAAEAYLFVPVTTGQLDYLLEDAFTNLGRYSVCNKMPAERLEAALDRYCRTLLVEARPHDPGVLATFLDSQRRTALECA